MLQTVLDRINRQDDSVVASVLYGKHEVNTKEPSLPFPDKDWPIHNLKQFVRIQAADFWAKGHIAGSDIYSLPVEYVINLPTKSFSGHQKYLGFLHKLFDRSHTEARPCLYKSSPTGGEKNSSILEALAEADKLLEWENNWDGDGAKPFEKRTIHKARNFLLECNRYIYQKFNFKIEGPIVGPTHQCALHLLWKMPKFKLLITIPEKDNVPISFYGEDKPKLNVVQGQLVNNRFSYLFDWIYEEMRNG